VSVEERSEALDPSPRRHVLLEDERRHDCPWPRQAELLGQELAKARLRVQRSERLLRVGERDLHLDDEEDLARCVPCQQIDAAPFSIPAVAGLSPDLPPPATDALGPCGLEGGMVLIQEAVEFRAVPGGAHFEMDVDGIQTAANSGNRQPLPFPSFEQRNG
jgi:hypothetical protein